MGNPHSKPEDRLRYINREVTSLRSSLRHSRQNLSRDKKEAIVESLAYQSGEVSSMHGKIKRKKIDETLKNISLTMEEVLQIESRDLDMGAVESDSFVHMPVSKRRANSAGSLVSQKTTKTTQSQPRNLNVNRSSPPTIREIEAKLDDLKSLINTALDNKDTKQLRVYKTTIEVLAGDLEMIPVDTDTPLEQRKTNLMKKLGILFQKISKALKEIKRDDNIEYLSTQSRKEKATNELEDIEVRLAENESILDRAIKEKNVVNVGTIRNNIVQINQKLSKVDIVDNEIKEKVVVLSQKLTEIVKNLDRTMAKKEFDSKFSKNLETYERTVKNFNGVANAEATINTLESLRNSLQNLEEINDTTKNRKRELLANINKQINNVEVAAQQESDRRTIQQIVEDTVVLRKKVKSTDKEYTVIDQFINYWNNVKSNFDINAYSHFSLLRIDGILEEMQQSMNAIRIEIANKCDTNPPTNLLRKHSQSVPKLNTRKNYGSGHSLDQLDSKIVKARAKMYNLSTPELLNVQQQEQSHVNNRFSKIEEIKMQVHYIKEKINESHNKNLLRDKLQSYLKDLTQFHKDPNQTVANNAVIVSNDITELLHILIVVDYKEKADKLIKRVQNFSGTRYDKEFDELKEELIKVQVSMENFEIPEQYKVLNREKTQVLDEIFYSIQSLQEKTSFYKRPENENYRKMKANIQTLTDKVKRFSGTYKGVLYNQIERDLNKLLLQIGEKVEDKINADEATKQVERLLKILEQRSSIAQSFRASKPETAKSEDQVGMAKIKNDLFNIKKDIDKTPEENIDAFIGLQSRLDLVNLELSQITPKSNENLAKEKDIFTNEVQSLRNVVEAKVTLSQQPLIQWPEREIQSEVINYPKNDINIEMEKLESKFQKIKDEVSAPNKGEDILKYYKLAQDIRKLLEKLDQYKLIKGTDLHMRKTTLLNEMQYYLEALEKEAKDTDYVINIEKKVDTLESILNSNQSSDLKVMAKELQAIQSKLDNHKVNPINETLKGRKTSVQQKTGDLAIKLKQMADSEAEKKAKQFKEDSKKIIDMEEKVKALRPEVLYFVGIQSDSKFYELDETTMRLILVLDKIETDNADLQQRKIKLLKELHNFGQILDERAQQTQEVVTLEQKLEEVSSLVQEFSGREEQLTQIKQKLEKIGKKIHSVRINKDLVSRKNACMERLSVMFNKIMTLVVSSPPPPPPPLSLEANNINIHSTGHSSIASSSRTTITQHSNLGYTTKLYNFSDTTYPSIPHDTQIIKQPLDSRLAQIEKDVKQLENLVKTTNDTKKLNEIDNHFTQCTIELSKLNYPKDSIEYKMKLGLFQTIENLSDFIEEKLDGNKQKTTIDEKGDVDAINNIELEVDKIGNKMNTPLTEEQIEELDERLIQLQVTLGKMNNPALKGEIDACMMKIILYAKNISDYKQSVDNTAF